MLYYIDEDTKTFNVNGPITHDLEAGKKRVNCKNLGER